MRSPLVVLAVSLSAVALGCGNDKPHPGTGDGGTYYACATETRAKPYMAGMSQASRAGTFTAKLLASEPGPPIKGRNKWTVQLLDSAATPTEGVTMKATPFMPDHAHGTSVKAEITPAGDGNYEIYPLYLFMAGYWEVTLDVETAAARDTIVFPVCISG